METTLNPTSDHSPKTKEPETPGVYATDSTVGDIAYRFMRRELEKFKDEEVFPGCFFILSGFSPEQTARFVITASQDPEFGSKLQIELPKNEFQGLLDDKYLVEHSAVHTRLADRDGKILISTDRDPDVGASINHKKTISANALKGGESAPEIWYEVISEQVKLLKLSTEQENQIQALIKGLFDCGQFGLKNCADYIRKVIQDIGGGDLLMIAAGLNLPLLRLPKYEDCFKPLAEKLGQPAKWRERFEQHQRTSYYLNRRNTDGAMLAPEELIKTFQRKEKEQQEGKTQIPADTLAAFEKYAKAAPGDKKPAEELFFNHEWASVRTFFEKASRKTPAKKFAEITRAALDLSKIEPTKIEKSILQDIATKSSRKPGTATEEEIEFYKTHADTIAAYDSKLTLEWEDYVYEKKATCTDFFDGIIEALRRRLSGMTAGFQSRVLIEGVRQSTPLGFDTLNEAACEYFQRHYGDLPKFTNNLVRFADKGSGKRETLLPFYLEKVKPILDERKKNKGKKSRTTKQSKAIEFRITLLEHPKGKPDEETTVCTIPLTWNFPSDSVLSNEKADLLAILKHAAKNGNTALAKGAANYSAVGKKGYPLTICLRETQGFAPSLGTGKAGSFIASPSKIQTIDTALEEILKNTEGNKISLAQASDLRGAIKLLNDTLKPALLAYATNSLDVASIPALASAYHALHETITQVEHGQTRKLLIRELLAFGNITVEEANHRPALSIICPWHPLRLEAHRGRVIQLSKAISTALSPTEHQFSDGRKGSLFFKDIKEFVDTPPAPELSVTWKELAAHTMVVTQSLGNYSLHEGATDFQQAQAVEDNAALAAQTILHEVDEYLVLQPHERDNLSILLYNCNSRELPARLVADLNKRNRDPHKPKINCEVLLTHHEPHHLQEIYQDLVADADEETIKPDETSGDFLSRVRINISAASSVKKHHKPSRRQPADIAYCRDLLSREATVKWDWMNLEGKTLPAEELKPHQWQRMRPFKDGDPAVRILLTCPAQTAANWGYIRSLGFVEEPNTDRNWKYGEAAIPMRVLDFDSTKVATILKETHELGFWVINQDEMLDRRLLENRNVKVIRYIQSASQGRNLIISSTARDTLLVNSLKKRLKVLLPSSTSSEVTSSLIRLFLNEANAVSGGLVLRAARRANNTNELLGLVLSKFLIQAQLGSEKKACWFLLDDYVHWLGKRDGDGIADLLVLSPTYKNGRPHLDILVSKAKFITPDILTKNKGTSETQLKSTLIQISQALNNDPSPLDQGLWLARISDMLLSRTVDGINQDGINAEEWRSFIRDRECTFSISGYSHIFLHTPAPTPVQGCSGIDTSKAAKPAPAYQEVFNSELVSNFILQMHDRNFDQVLIERTRLGHPKFDHQEIRDISEKPKPPGNDSEDGNDEDTGDQKPPTTPPASPSTTSSAKSSDGESEKPNPEKTAPGSAGLTGMATQEAASEKSHPTATSEDPLRAHLIACEATQATDDSGAESWLADTVEQLRSALLAQGMSAKFAEGKPPILTPNAGLIRLQGGAHLTIKQLEAKSDELYTTYGLKILGFSPGQKYISISVARPDRQTLHTTSVFLELLNSGMAEESSNNENIFVAIKEEDGTPIFLEPHTNPHTLVSGITGSGKSVLIGNIMLYIGLTRSPAQSRIYLTDGKQGIDFYPYQNLPHLELGSGKVITDKDESIELFSTIVEEMENRLSLFKEASADNIRSYRQKTGKEMPTLWVIQDEFTAWMIDKEYAEAVTAFVNRIAVQSRATGIFMIFGTQRPDNSVMPMQLRSQLGNRLALKVSDAGTAEIATGIKNSRAEHLLKKGHMLAKPDADLIYSQVPFIDKDTEVQPLIELIRQRYSKKPTA